MHIPSTMLNGAICPVTLAVGIAGGLTAVYFSGKQEEKPGIYKFATVTSMIFAMQMLNFPVLNGTSGHLLGGVLAASLLGTPFAVLSIIVVLTVQAAFFGDGGINALGANAINMGLIGAGAAGYLLEILKKKGINKTIALAFACWVSVILASLACALEVAFSGTVQLSKVIPAMLSIHALIGMGEAILTIVIVSLVNKFAENWKSKEMAVTSASLALALFASMLSPLASSFPDGLEWVSSQLSFAMFKGISIPVIFQDYQVPFIHHPALSTMLAGLAGVVIIFSTTFLVTNFLKIRFSTNKF